MDAVTIAAKQAYNQKIITMLRTSANVIDDHDSVNNIRAVDKIALFSKDGNEHVILLSDDRYFSINPLKLKSDGVVHLSTSAVGGVVDVWHHGGLQKAIDAYNAVSVNHKAWDCGTIGAIITL